jgi:hypothetical protein
MACENLVKALVYLELPCLLYIKELFADYPLLLLGKGYQSCHVCSYSKLFAVYLSHLLPTDSQPASVVCYGLSQEVINA